MKRVPDARLSSQVPHLEFDILKLFKGSSSGTRTASNTVTYLDRLHVEANCCTIAVSANVMDDQRSTSHSLGIVETTSPI